MGSGLRRSLRFRTFVEMLDSKVLSRKIGSGGKKLLVLFIEHICFWDPEQCKVAVEGKVVSVTFVASASVVAAAEQGSLGIARVH